MSNYYVRRTNKYDDELAHSLGGWLKRRAQGAHKYIAKIPIGGKMRYFYTQAELAAYKAGKTVGKAATNVKNRLTVTGAQGRYTVKRIGADAKAAAGRAGKLVTGAGKKVRSTATGLANEVANRTGLTARSQRDNAANPLERYHAQKRYDRTPLGTAEGAIRGAGRRAGELAGRAENAIKSAPGKVRGAASSAGRAVSKTAKRAGTAVANATGYSERQRAKRLRANANRRVRTANATGRIRDDYNAMVARTAAYNAEQSYGKTALGRAERAAKSVKSTVTSAPGRVAGAASGAARSVSRAANDWRKKRYLKRQSKKGANA